MSLRSTPAETINRGIESARKTDSMFHGHGRYEWEYRSNNKDLIAELGNAVLPVSPECQEWIDEEEGK